MNDETNTPVEEKTEQKIPRKLIFAVFGALVVGLGIYLDAIPIAMITELFQTKAE